MKHYSELPVIFWEARQAYLLRRCLGLVVLTPPLAQAAMLENPMGGLFVLGR